MKTQIVLGLDQTDKITAVSPPQSLQQKGRMNEKNIDIFCWYNCTSDVIIKS